MSDLFLPVFRESWNLSVQSILGTGQRNVAFSQKSSSIMSAPTLQAINDLIADVTIAGYVHAHANMKIVPLTADYLDESARLTTNSFIYLREPLASHTRL